MDLLTDATAVPAEPPVPALTGVRGYFTGGIPGQQGPTRIRYWHLNALQNEIVNAILAAGLQPSTADETQLAQAIRQAVTHNVFVFGAVFLGWNWVAPAGWFDAHVMVVGAGAGGGAGGGYAGFGGSSGGLSWGRVPLVPGTAYTGISGFGGNPGGPGGTSTFLGITATGGNPGYPGDSAGPGSSQFGEPGAGFGGALNLIGGSGGAPSGPGNGWLQGGQGGSVFFGGEGQGGFGSGSNGSPAFGPGAGGGGGTGPYLGGVGAPGLTIIWR